jgi:hypothetical protein
MGHSQGKPYDWRRALARMTDAPETSWRSSCPPQEAVSAPGFHKNKMANRRQNIPQRFRSCIAQAFSVHVSDHCLQGSTLHPVPGILWHSEETGLAYFRRTGTSDMCDKKQQTTHLPMASPRGLDTSRIIQVARFRFPQLGSQQRGVPWVRLERSRWVHSQSRRRPSEYACLPGSDQLTRNSLKES